MRAIRFFLFALMIALGFAGGLAYGWSINPVKYEDTSPDKLHPAFKADYVLMVAEIYKADQNLQAAEHRLTFLGSQPADQIAAEGVLTARRMNYDLNDLELMNQLALALQGQSPTPQSGEQP